MPLTPDGPHTALLRRWLGALAVAVLTATAIGSVSPAAPETARPVRWTMATPYGEHSFHTANIRAFAADVETATQGKLTITIHAAGSLYRHAQIKNAVRSGQIQLGEFLLSRLANEAPVFEVDSVPFLARDYSAARALWAASRAIIERRLERQGLSVLFAVPWPPQGLFSRRPVNSLDDLEGVRFRAYNVASERLARRLGAVPTQVEVPDIAQAFLTGRVDAMITSPTTGVNVGAWDFVRYYYDLGAWLPKNVVVVNRRALMRLAPAMREAVLAAARRAETRGWRLSAAETRDKLDTLRSHGVAVLTPSPELAAGFARLGQALAEDWARRAGADGAAILRAMRTQVPAGDGQGRED